MRGKVTEGLVKKGGVNPCNDNCPKPPAPKGSGGKAPKEAERAPERKGPVTLDTETFHLVPLDFKRFENKYGRKAFLKVCLLATHNALLKKGILSEEELLAAFDDVAAHYKG